MRDGLESQSFLGFLTFHSSTVNFNISIEILAVATSASFENTGC